MSKRIKKAFAILTALVMVFAMSTTAFAASGTGYYEVGSAATYSNPITVKVVVQSGKTPTSGSAYINDVRTITVGQSGVSGQTFTVRDAMIAYNAGGYGITACDNTGNAITSTSDYIYQFKKGTTAFAPSFSGTHGYSSAFLLDGWMFRVNGKLPVQAGTGSSSDPQGTDIVHTPIADGDVIMFYMDYPWKENGVRQSVDFISADANYTNGELNIQLKTSNSWFGEWTGNTFPWHIESYSNYTPANKYSATVYNSAGTSVGSVVLDLTGAGSKSITLSANETYYVKVAGVRATKTITGKNANNNTISCSYLARPIAYDRVTMD